MLMLDSVATDTADMQAPSRRLGEFLVDRKVLSRDVLEHLLERKTAENLPLSKLLLSEGLVGEKDLVAAVAAQVGFRFVDFDQTPVNPTLDRIVPAELAQRHLAVAVDLEGNDLLVAMLDPSDRQAVGDLERATGFSIKPAIAVRGDLRRVVAAMYGGEGAGEARSAAGPAETLAEIPVDETISVPLARDAGGGGSLLDDDTGVDIHVNDLLERVVDLGGSDLHLTVGLHPCVRVHGDVKPLTEFSVMNGSEIRRMVYAILTQRQREKFENEL